MEINLMHLKITLCRIVGSFSMTISTFTAEWILYFIYSYPSPLDKKFRQNRKRGHINGTLGYASQMLWIQKDTIKNNILFFKKYNKEKYEEVLCKCQLNYDLANWRERI